MCGKSFNVDHTLNCSTGGFPTICHNKIRDFTAKLLTEVCHDVCVEPPLQALSGEHLTHDTANREDNARLDVKTRGFRGTSHQCAFFDVRVFDPNPESYHDFEMATCYRRHEGEKRHVYKNRVREVEHGSFTPLVFSTSRGMGRAATVAYKRLATLYCSQERTTIQKRNGLANVTFSFSLLRCAVMCLRGSCSRQGFAPHEYMPIDLVVQEGRIPTLPSLFIFQNKCTLRTH